MAGSASPTLTAASMSSYGMASPRASTRRLSVSSFSRLSDNGSDSGDEVVWSLASSNTSSADVDDDDDFVVLSRRPAIRAANQALVEERSVAPEHPLPLAAVASAAFTDVLCNFRGLSIACSGGRISPSIQAQKGKTEITSPLSVPPALGPIAGKKKKKGGKKLAKVLTTDDSVQTKRATKRKRKKAAPKKAAATPAPSAAEDGTINSQTVEEASTFISSFLASPEAKADPVCRLTLLQSLIIELGLISSSLSLPASLRSAKKLIQTSAFLNIRDYMAVRSQGQKAIRNVLYPSRSALIKDIRRKRNHVSLQWVKERGLQVFLVGCFS